MDAEIRNFLDGTVLNNERYSLKLTWSVEMLKSFIKQVANTKVHTRIDRDQKTHM